MPEEEQKGREGGREKSGRRVEGGKAAWWVGWGAGQGAGGVGQRVGSCNKTEKMLP